MHRELVDAFCWLSTEGYTENNDNEKYQALINWSMSARGKNPLAFDALIQWMLDDAQWTPDRLGDSIQLLTEDIIGRFKAQNAVLRARLEALRPSGLVNEAVFPALDRFDSELSGHTYAEALKACVSRVFADFSVLQQRGIREQFAGSADGPTGTDTVDIFGYVNYLKDCDAAIQWTLFMPQVVEQQQQGFRVVHFEYRKLPALRLIGFEGCEYDNRELRMNKMRELDALNDHLSELKDDVLFMHHYGLGVDVGPWHGVWGRFMKAGTPVPEGFLHFDFVPEPDDAAGPPYISQLAYAEFAGDLDAMHAREGFDSDAMYDVTRNIILGQSILIPYPAKYWTAEVFPQGCGEHSSAYMFSVDR